jgi:hypothetical protein
MKAESFIKLMRTIINEEVRKVVREELHGVINESTTPTSRPNLRDKYKSQFDPSFSMTSLMDNSTDSIPLRNGTPALVNVSNNPTVNSILMETANQMRMDPGSNAFYEGLR